MHDRVEQLNEATHQVVTRRGALCLDVHLMPGAYDSTAWSVDRLHPSERGHRMRAAGVAALRSGTGSAVPHPVDLACSDGRQVTAADHIAWLLLEGVPWLGRRGREFLPHALALVLRDLLGRGSPVPSRYVRR